MKTALYFTIGCFTALFVLPTIPYGTGPSVDDSSSLTSWNDTKSINQRILHDQEALGDSIASEIRIKLKLIASLQ